MSSTLGTDVAETAALRAVRTWGGVLEHPAGSSAWPAFGLPEPPSGGGWAAMLFDGGWTCHVEQGHYGHRARKATWLYACRVHALPSLQWGPSNAHAWVSYCGNATRGHVRERLTKAQAKATPVLFRDLLVSIARGCL